MESARGRRSSIGSSSSSGSGASSSIQNGIVTVNGDEWRISHQYSSIKQLDIKISEGSDAMRHIAFPVIDSRTFKSLKKAYDDDNIRKNDMKLLKYIILMEEYRSRIEAWCHALLQRLHLLPEYLRFRVMATFFIPSGILPEGTSLIDDITADETGAPSSIIIFIDNVTAKVVETDNKSTRSRRSAAVRAVTAIASSSKGKSTLITSIKEMFGFNATLTRVALENAAEGVTADSAELPPHAPRYGPHDQRRQEHDARVASELRQEMLSEAKLASKTPLLNVSVNRGREGRRDRIEYEIKIEAIHRDSKSSSSSGGYRIEKRYSAFRELWEQLADMNVVNVTRLKRDILDAVHHTSSAGNPGKGQHVGGSRTSTTAPSGELQQLQTEATATTSSLTSNSPTRSVISVKSSIGPPHSPTRPPSALEGTMNHIGTTATVIYIMNAFPLPPWKCSLGVALSESDLSFRARHLDLWFREICYSYSIMPSAAKSAVLKFLGLNMSKQSDIDIQHALTQGLVVAPRAESPSTLLALTTGLNNFNLKSSGGGDSRSSTTKRSSIAGGNTGARGSVMNPSRAGSIVSGSKTGRSKLGSMDGDNIEYGSQDGSDDEFGEGQAEEEDFVPGPISVEVIAHGATSFQKTFELSPLYFKYQVCNAICAYKHPVLVSKPGPRNILQIEQYVLANISSWYTLQYRLPNQEGATVLSSSSSNSYILGSSGGDIKHHGYALSLLERLSESELEGLEDAELFAALPVPPPPSANKFPFTSASNAKKGTSTTATSTTNGESGDRSGNPATSAATPAKAPPFDPNQFMRIGMTDDDDHPTAGRRSSLRQSILRR